MKIGNGLLVLLFLVLGLVASSCAKTTSYSFYDDYQRTNAEYLTGDIAAVRESLAGFLGRAVNNPAAVQSEKRLNSDVILGEAWLRVAAAAKAQGDAAVTEEALSRAIPYFDKVPNFASDADYRANKAATLTAFLQKAEAANPPKWKK